MNTKNKASQWKKATKKTVKDKTKRQGLLKKGEENLTKVEQDKIIKNRKSAHKVEVFLKTKEGLEGLGLLRSTKKHIWLGDTKSDCYGFAYFLDGGGLKKSYEAMGMWTAYASDIKKPEISDTTAEEANYAYHKQEDLSKNQDMLAYIIKELDQIAKDVLKKGAIIS